MADLNRLLSMLNFCLDLDLPGAPVSPVSAGDLQTPLSLASVPQASPRSSAASTQRDPGVAFWGMGTSSTTPRKIR